MARVESSCTRYRPKPFAHAVEAPLFFGRQRRVFGCSEVSGAGGSVCCGSTQQRDAKLDRAAEVETNTCIGMDNGADHQEPSHSYLLWCRKYHVVATSSGGSLCVHDLMASEVE